MGQIMNIMQGIQAQGEAGRQRGLSQLVGQAYNAPADQRQAILGRVAAQGEPGMAYDAQKHFEGMDDTARTKLGQYAMAFDALPDEQKATAYPQLAAQAKALGIPAPSEWNPAFAPNITKLAQTLGGGKAGVHVSQRYVTDSGDVVLIMSDGSRVLSGDKADPRTQLRDQPGIDPSIVTLSGQNRGSVSPLGGAPQQPQGPQRAPGEVPFSIDPSLPPEVQASIRSNESQWAQAPDGAQIGIGGGGSIPSQAPAPAQGNLAAARPDYAGQAATRADEAAAFARQRAAVADSRAGIPAGYQPDGKGGAVFIPGGPADPAVIARIAAAKPNATQSKTTAAIKAKVPQLQNAIRGLGRIETALKALDTPGLNTGPMDQYAQRFTKAGQELDAAVGGIQNSFLALTRVPGIGSQSDLEARIALLQYPSLDKHPEVNRRTLDNLKLFARDLAKAYELAATQGVPDSGDVPQGGGNEIHYDAQGNRIQ